MAKRSKLQKGITKLEGELNDINGRLEALTKERDITNKTLIYLKRIEDEPTDVTA